MKTLHCNHRFTKACYYYQEPALETELTDEESVTAEEENYNYLKFHSERERRQNSPVNKAVIKAVQLLEDCGENLSHLGQVF